ncbi:M24 family metallopeptidase [Aquimarina muelleri]|uniref:Xaa-Pro aminopeptidase n=1 Tax=Aquimarina muelleri TaxID=279356 RepID=A0A918N2G9_9FLAO|nr:M24 family metallopeptidase [Aquimarina muelleri]MCX2762070.1 M24 family metallopeptidase [Aquimarina muelleri]GGX04219.1 Xaa-Pro aminopeptidase [Aquimarina muelleri]
MRLFIFFTIFIAINTAQSQILTERERSNVVDMVLDDRFNNLLPKLMDREGFDMWVLISREYNEDPVLKTMLPATWLNARRRTILVFYRNKENNIIEKLAVARYNVGKNIDSAWDKEKQPNQWKALVEIISKRDPKKIGINYSKDFGILDGIVKTDYEEFLKVLPQEYKSRVTSAEKLAIAWIETRTPQELEIYKELVKITHNIIEEAFSTSVIQPGTTTTDDVVWWLRQKVTDMGLKTWFHPTVDIQRSSEVLQNHIVSFSDKSKDRIIKVGDLIHCDFGITYLRLNTDCQQHAYILKNNETSPPDFLVKAFAEGNQVQDIFTSNFETGKTGNEILLKSLEESKKKGLRPSIYTHPLGLYGHSAGTTIGMWDAQQGIKGTGDYPLYEDTVYAIELNTTVTLPEWKKDIRIMLEEAGFWTSSGFKYINERQTELITIPKRK